MDICNICAEPYNRRDRKRVECFACEETACQKCIQKYLLSVVSLSSHCMFCRVEWSRMFLSKTLTAQYLQTLLKNHHENLLFQREKCLFPQTIPLIEQNRRLRGIREQQFQLARKIRDLQNQQNKLQEDYNDEERLYRLMLREGVRRTSEKLNRPCYQYQRPCSRENCRGYLRQHLFPPRFFETKKDKGKIYGGVCGLCETLTCWQCNIPLDIGIDQLEDETQFKGYHTCRKEDIEVWDFIKSSTKPCPGCNVRIHKISGCDQMWCPQCHTAFLWSSGTIEKGTVHNPHYFEWLFQNPGGNPRNEFINDLNRCDNHNINVSAPVISRFLNNFHLSSEQHTQKRIIGRWLNFRRIIHHIDIVELPRLQRNERQNYGNDNEGRRFQSLRIRFLENCFDEDSFRTQLQRRHKKILKEHEVLRIYTTVSQIGREILIHLLQSKSVDEILKCTENLDRFIQCINSGINDINKCFSSSVPLFE